jgi:hypothetical protein
MRHREFVPAHLLRVNRLLKMSTGAQLRRKSVQGQALLDATAPSRSRPERSRDREGAVDIKRGPLCDLRGSVPGSERARASHHWG